MTEGERDSRFTRERFLAAAAGAAVAGPLFAVASRPARATALASLAPRRGGTLRVGVGGGASTETLDPANAVTTVEIARVAQINETLLYFDPNFKLAYGLAEAVESNKKATQWTIRLRQGVEFHNGKPLTAQDVIYTIRRITDKKNPGAAANRFATLSPGGMRALDKHTVRLAFAKPYSSFPDVLALAATNSVRIVPVGFDLHHPIGTGPFKYQSFTPGRQSVFVRNAHYWHHGEPYLDKVVIIDINDDAARINALVSGQVDAIAGVPNTNVGMVKGNPKLVLLESPTAGWNPIVMRVDVPPFTDVRVRRAFKLIADRPQFISSALAGEGAIANDLYGRYDPAYDHSLPQRHVDAEQAKSLLKQAGQENLTIQFVTSDIAPGENESAQVFAQQASAAGVQVSLLKVEPTEFWSRHFMKATLTQSNWASRTFLLQAADSMMPSAPYNETHWKNATWLNLVNQALATTNESLKSELIHKAQSLEWDQGGYLNWGWTNNVDAYSKRVSGLLPDRGGIPLTTFRFANVSLAS